MNDPRDPLLHALGDLERAVERDHPGAWEDALVGRRPVAEVAQSGGGETSAEEHAALAALFTAPIPDAEVEGLVARSVATWEPGPAVVRPVVVPLYRRGTTWSAVAAVIAFAAALVLWRRDEPLRGPGELVAYQVTVRSQSLHSKRAGDTGEGHRYRSDSTIDIVINPERAVTEAIEVRVLATDGEGHQQLLKPPVTRTAEGVMRLTGTVSEVLPLAPGHWRLRFILGSAGATRRCWRDRRRRTPSSSRSMYWRSTRSR